MTWLIWRQHRYEILAMLVGAAFIAIGLVYGADYVPRIRAELGVDTCRPLPTTSANCAILSTQASDLAQPFRWLVLSLFFVPAVVGSFIGGPLFARDLERGTHRLAWTQSVTRMRWSAAKLLSILGIGFVAAALVASVGGRAGVINGVQAYIWEQTVSFTPLAAAASVVTNPFQNFDFEGPAFVGYVVFAIAIAAFVGTLSRRILVGMFAGLLLFGVVRLGVYELRPNYQPPMAAVYSAATPFPQTQVPPGAWVTRVDFLDPSGQVVPQDRVTALLNAYRPLPPRFDTLAYMADNGALQRVQYQPADRYWRFQWTEGLLFLVLTVGFSAAALMLLERRDA
jgi:hypothetical protein